MAAAALLTKLRGFDSWEAWQSLSAAERGILAEQLEAMQIGKLSLAVAPAGANWPAELLAILDAFKAPNDGATAGAELLLQQLRAPSGRDCEIVEGLVLWLLEKHGQLGAQPRGASPYKVSSEQFADCKANVLYKPAKDLGVDLFMLYKVPGTQSTFQLILVQVKFGRTPIARGKATSTGPFTLWPIKKGFERAEDALQEDIEKYASAAGGMFHKGRWSKSRTYPASQRWIYAPGGFRPSLVSAADALDGILLADEDALWAMVRADIMPLMGTSLGPVFGALERRFQLDEAEEPQA